ncbi:uncharacterized protein [Gossypium hirsutum]|uniref:Uncharacterized protein n=1 Tax=Gossypium hirsutum TaxID=3635 RepID=A0ABM3A8J6_GOSHI|nr:uncharacterized protein LOC121218278 [Gossypium hirsutum]
MFFQQRYYMVYIHTSNSFVTNLIIVNFVFLAVFAIHFSDHIIDTSSNTVSPSVVSVTDNKSGRYTRAITTLPVFKVPTAEISAQSRADSSPASDTSALDSSSNGVLGYTSISPIGTLTPIVEQQRPTSVNCHPMMTRSKMGFYKPKAYMVMISNVEP